MSLRSLARRIAANPVLYAGYAVALDAAICPANQKTRIFATNLSGTIFGIGAVAIVGQLSVDGNGNVTGSGAFDVNGTVLSGSSPGPAGEAPVAREPRRSRLKDLA